MIDPKLLWQARLRAAHYGAQACVALERPSVIPYDRSYGLLHAEVGVGLARPFSRRFRSKNSGFSGPFMCII